MPGTPTSVTSCGSRSRRARSSAPTSASSSCSPADERGTPDLADVDAEPRPRLEASHTATGSVLPFASIGRCSRYEITRSVARYVVSSTRMPFTGAADWSRAAVLTTSPEAIPSPAPRPERDERLAGRDPDPDLEVGFLERPLADRQRRAHRALRVVLVSYGSAEERHDRVADELLDRAAEALEVPAHPLEERREQRAHVLRVEALGARRRADEVAEEHGDDLPLLAGRLAGQPAAPHAPQKRKPSGFSCPQLGQITAQAYDGAALGEHGVGQSGPELLRLVAPFVERQVAEEPEREAGVGVDPEERPARRRSGRTSAASCACRSSAATCRRAARTRGPSRSDPSARSRAARRRAPGS